MSSYLQVVRHHETTERKHMGTYKSSADGSNKKACIKKWDKETEAVW